MMNQFSRFLTAAIFAFSLTGLAQTGEASAALPTAPSAATTSTASVGTGTKFGTINVEQAIFGSNEGQRAVEELSKKLEPKQNELKGQNDEVESLKKKLNDQGPKMNDEARGELVKQIEQKQKLLERSVQDARDDAQAQQSEVAQKILQKMAPLINKYAADNGFGVIVDTSSPWPNGPVFWQNGAVDITRAVVEAYNVQSGVPAPTAKPAGSASRPGGSASKPATSKPATSKPATSDTIPPAK